jgi:hypothetical protein
MFHWRRVSAGQSGGDRCRVFVSRAAEQASRRRAVAALRQAKLEVVNAKA